MFQVPCSQHSFTDNELRTLISLYIEKKILLEHKHAPAVTEQKKKKIWKEIVDAVNACGSGQTRTIDQLKKKIADCKRNARDWVNESKRPKTGGGKGKKKMWYYPTHCIGPPNRNCVSKYWVGLKVRIITFQLLLSLY